jgi:non-heme chloroperoxidase
LVVPAEVRGAQASWYDGVGHLPFLEDSARFDRELDEFATRAN